MGTYLKISFKNIFKRPTFLEHKKNVSSAPISEKHVSKTQVTETKIDK